MDKSRVRSALDALCFHSGYTLIVAVAVVSVMELLSMVVAGVYYGAFHRLSVVAPDIAPADTDHTVFSLRNLLIDDVRRASGVYAGQPWAEAFLAETGELQSSRRQRYEPFAVWGNAEFHGTYINIDAGATGTWRRTGAPCPQAQSGTVRVWVLGGSVVLGLDTPDFATIPAYLSRALTTPGRCIEVTNFGVVGHVINQHAIVMADLLKRGYRPDIVLVLAGANEIGVGIFAPGLAWTHGDFFEIKRRVEDAVPLGPLLERSYGFTIARAVARRLAPDRVLGLAAGGGTAPLDVSPTGVQAKVQQVLDNFEATVDLMGILSRAYGFRLRVFWQPILLVGRPHPDAFERALLENPAFRFNVSVLDEFRVVVAVYQEAERRARHGRFVFLGRVFESIGEPVYSDGLHLGPRGNEVVAGAMAAALAP